MADNNKNNGNGNGTANQDQKKENFFKRAWAKVPDWGKKTIKIVGFSGLVLGAYALGKGRSDDDDPEMELPEPDDVIDMPEE